MFQHVYERACQAQYLSEVIIATDDERIFSAARDFGSKARMTRSDHLSGSDRAAEVAASDSAAYIVNIQGDEPMIDPAAIDAAVLALVNESGAPMSTLAKRIEQQRDIDDPNTVKVVTDLRGYALYFSRSPIPYVRGDRPPYFKHIGLYAYRREFLLGYSAMPVGPLERAEKLEQLRALENGHSIRVAETEYESVGVDTPEDLERLLQYLKNTQAEQS